MRRNFEGISFLSVGLALAIMAVSGCIGGSGDPGDPVDTEGLSSFCLELLNNATVGSGRDGIPSLTDPDMVAADDALADYLLPTDRVIGIKAGSDYLAFPHNILWWHEIVNVRNLGLAITYCQHGLFQRGGRWGRIRCLWTALPEQSGNVRPHCQ